MIPIADKIIEKYYDKNSEAYKYLYEHSLSVTSLALKIAEHNQQFNLNTEYLKTAGMLHDIGIFMTHAPGIGCHGDQPYLAHGYLGRALLDQEGLKDVAPVCERHVGVGLTIADIERDNLPLPKRDMVPMTLVEKVICYADKFYSKKPKHLNSPKPLEKIRNKVSKYGPDKRKIFEEFVEMFGWEYIYE
ncbi:MAG: HDIG domain-containing protein [Bacteroidales bacterium]|nr:HDIG domain-containing protein [Bacteroidales bacterium]MCF8345048.1 HDIG domain-containing protein [Bacteroidales bacterium]MCF8352644.1 HDIG domain-containing protein [Bacteroidales bacterium]MCF8375719.1 HDIG domain-containing protein [Bacteroidales bacterium]MCF8400319.1 HDIG domain-containing protein [Bacteroidales bacterium]